MIMVTNDSESDLVCNRQCVYAQTFYVCRDIAYQVFV